MQSSLSIIGAGNWGSALAVSLSAYYNSIHLWCYSDNEKKSLPDQVLKNTHIKPSFDLVQIKYSQAVLVVVPSNAFSQTLKAIKPYLHTQKIAWASKGFDIQSGQLLSQSFAHILPNYAANLISGPSFANEVLWQNPTALVVSGNDEQTQQYWAKALQTNSSMRAYLNKDLIGAQIGGGVKNILAIAAGIVAGLGYGANTQAALITRGLTEMVRLGLSLGAKRETFMGLTGLGDLVLTCSDNLSRNRQFGKALIKYGNVTQAKQSVNSTVEGLNALKITLDLAKKHCIEMPICQQVHRVIYDNISTQEVIKSLMSRDIVLENK